MTPDTIYTFITGHGKLVSSTTAKDEANSWLKHRKVGDTVAEYTLKKAATKRKGDK